MLPLIPLIAALSLASASASLKLLPYAYLSSPVPVYQQFQNSQTGEHAFSYAGGPSAQEEIKDADGVLRGSYSYIDANGVLQSAFYVADENGFRVAATNLPTDQGVQLEAAHVVLARSTQAQEQGTGRRRRSVPQEPGQPAGEASSSDPVSSQQQRQAPSGGAEDEKSLGTGKALYQPLLLTSDIPLATSHQSQVQVHSNARLDLAQPEIGSLSVQPVLPVQTYLSGIPVLARAPTYHENRIELHKDLGIEGAQPKDAVKIDPEPLTLVQAAGLPVASTILAKEAVQVLPVVSKEALLPVVPAGSVGSASVAASVSSHGISQLHGPSRTILETVPANDKQTVPGLVENRKEIVPLLPLTKETSGLASATVTTSISSHGLSQVHGDSRLKIEPSLLVRTAQPIAQLHPIIDVPLHYLH